MKKRVWKRPLCMFLTVLMMLIQSPLTALADIDPNADGSGGGEAIEGRSRYFFNNYTSAVRVTVVNKTNKQVMGHSIDILSPKAWDFIGNDNVTFAGNC